MAKNIKAKIEVDYSSLAGDMSKVAKTIKSTTAQTFGFEGVRLEIEKSRGSVKKAISEQINAYKKAADELDKVLNSHKELSQIIASNAKKEEASINKTHRAHVNASKSKVSLAQQTAQQKKIIAQKVAAQRQMLNQKVAAQQQMLENKVAETQQMLTAKVAAQQQMLANKVAAAQQTLTQKVAAQQQMAANKTAQHQQAAQAKVANAMHKQLMTSSGIYGTLNGIVVNISNAIGNIIRRTIILSTVIAAARAVVQTINNSFRKMGDELKGAIAKIDEFNAIATGVAAQLASMAKNPGPETFVKTLQYSRDVMQKLEFESMRHLATGEELRTVFSSFATLRVVPNSEKDIEAIGNITDAIKMMTYGQDFAKQGWTEIRALVNGIALPSSILARYVKSQVGDLKSAVTLHKRQGDLIQWIGGMLKGYAYAQSSITQLASTWKNNLETIHNVISRRAFSGVYKDITGYLREIGEMFKTHDNKLSEISKILIEKIQGSWIKIKDDVGKAFQIIAENAPTVIASIAALLADVIQASAKAIQGIRDLVQMVKMARNWIPGVKKVNVFGTEAEYVDAANAGRERFSQKMIDMRNRYPILQKMGSERFKIFTEEIKTYNQPGNKLKAEMDAIQDLEENKSKVNKIMPGVGKKFVGDLNKFLSGGASKLIVWPIYQSANDKVKKVMKDTFGEIYLDVQEVAQIWQEDVRMNMEGAKALNPLGPGPKAGDKLGFDINDILGAYNIPGDTNKKGTGASKENTEYDAKKKMLQLLKEEYEIRKMYVEAELVQVQIEYNEKKKAFDNDYKLNKNSQRYQNDMAALEKWLLDSRLEVRKKYGKMVEEIELSTMEKMAQYTQDWTAYDLALRKQAYEKVKEEIDKTGAELLEKQILFNQAKEAIDKEFDQKAIDRARERTNKEFNIWKEAYDKYYASYDIAIAKAKEMDEMVGTGSPNTIAALKEKINAPAFATQTKEEEEAAYKIRAQEAKEYFNLLKQQYQEDFKLQFEQTGYTIKQVQARIAERIKEYTSKKELTTAEKIELGALYETEKVAKEKQIELRIKTINDFKASFHDFLVSMAKGQVDFQGFINSIWSSLANTFAEYITSMIFQLDKLKAAQSGVGSGNLFGLILSGLTMAFSGGATAALPIGAPAPIPIPVIAHSGGLIPRLHGGGGFGLKQDERMAILQVGEYVVPRKVVSSFNSFNNKSQNIQIVVTGNNFDSMDIFNKAMNDMESRITSRVARSIR